MARQKWKEWSEDPEKLRVLAAWARSGMTDEQIAGAVGVSRSTLAEWKRKHGSIRKALAEGKEIADRLVEDSLYQMTQGKIVKLKKTFKLRKKGVDENGKPYEREELVQGEDEAYVEPDIKAIIFWLKNRMREDWKEKVEAVVEEEEGTGAIILTPRVIAEMKEEVRNDRKGKTTEAKTAKAKKDRMDAAGEAAADDGKGGI